MKDWTQMAKAAGYDIPAKDLARLAPALDALEGAFRPLVRNLTPEAEPSPVFRAGEDNS